MEPETEEKLESMNIVPKKEWIAEVIALSVVLQFFLIIATMIIFPLQKEKNEFFYMLSGQLAGAFTTIVTFYFGSSYKKN